MVCSPVDGGLKDPHAVQAVVVDLAVKLLVHRFDGDPQEELHHIDQQS